MTIELGVLIGVAGTMFGIAFGYLGHQRAAKNEIKTDSRDHTELKTNVDYIRRGVDDIRLDLKAQETRVTDLAGEVIRIGESTKSAHKRLDKMEGRNGGEK